jgi:nucleoside-diphosphate-sugar epimerase
MKVLVTGAGGLVGRALFQMLQARYCSCRVAVRTGAVQGTPIEQVAVGNIDERTQWAPALQGCTEVVHLAARVHQIGEYGDQAIGLYRITNVEGTLHLAQQAAQAGVRRFVFLSTVKVLGESTTGRLPFTESDPACPLDGYSQSKWEAEQGLHAIARATGMEVVIIRPPLVYGPGVKANFAALMGMVQKGWPLPLGAVQNRRSFVGVGNLVDFIMVCLTDPRAANHTFLVSDDSDVSTTELLQALAFAANKPPRLWPMPEWALRGLGRALGQRARVERLLGSLQIDIRFAKSQLGWAPPHSVAQGLQHLYVNQVKP